MRNLEGAEIEVLRIQKVYMKERSTSDKYSLCSLAPN